MRREGLYIATIAADAERVAKAYDAGLELNALCMPDALDWSAARQDARLHAQMGGLLGERCILHGPYAEIFPCAIDPRARQLAMDRLLTAARAALRCGIRRMVAHAGFLPNVYMPEWFVPQSAAFWRIVLTGRTSSISRTDSSQRSRS